MGVLGRWLGDQEGLELGSLHPSLEAHNCLPLHLQKELSGGLWASTDTCALVRLHTQALSFSSLPPSSPEMIGNTAVTMVIAPEKAAPGAGESATLFTTRWELGRL